jgi:hypothetical protein
VTQGEPSALSVNASRSGGAVGALDRAAAYLQPQTLTSVVRHTYGIYFRHWLAVCLAYLPMLPGGVLSALLPPEGGAAMLVSVLHMFVAVLVGSVLTVQVSDICLGVKPSVRRAYRRAFAMPGRLIGSYLLMLLLVFAVWFVALIALLIVLMIVFGTSDVETVTSAATVLSVIPATALFLRYIFTLQAAVAEEIGGRAALKRSGALGRGSYWRNLGVLLCTSILATLVYVLLALPFVALGAETNTGVMAVYQGVASVVAAPLFTIPVVLLYYDMRVRKEGYGADQMSEDWQL